MKIEFYSTLIKRSLSTIALFGLSFFSCNAQATIVTCKDKDDESQRFTLETLPGNAEAQVLRTYFAWSAGYVDNLYVRTNTNTQEGVVTETYTLLSSLYQNQNKEEFIKYNKDQQSDSFEVQFEGETGFVRKWQ